MFHGPINHTARKRAVSFSAFLPWRHPLGGRYGMQRFFFNSWPFGPSK